MAKCIYPITLSQKEGMKRFKVVPCGKCVPCKRRRQAAWSFRLLQEMEHSKTSAFITLTYNDENIVWGDKGATLVKRDFQLFMKRLRKKQATLTNAKIVYYACGEYGHQTHRPHYHAIIFNLHESLLWDLPLSDIWQNGNVRVDACNVKSIQYTTKYVMKSGRTPEGVEPEFALMSKGIGKRYLTPKVKKFYKDNQIPYVVWKDGQKMTMPRYFKEQIFEEEELRKFGEEALKMIKPQTLDSTKVFEINEMNHREKLKRDGNRKKI